MCSAQSRLYNICVQKHLSCLLLLHFCPLQQVSSATVSWFVSKMVAKKGCWFIFQSQDWPYLCANEPSNCLFKEVCNVLRSRFKCGLYNITTGWFVNGGCSGGRKEIERMNHYPDKFQKQFKSHFIITDVCQIYPSSTSCRLWFLWSLQDFSFVIPTVTFCSVVWKGERKKKLMPSKLSTYLSLSIVLCCIHKITVNMHSGIQITFHFVFAVSSWLKLR